MTQRLTRVVGWVGLVLVALVLGHRPAQSEQPTELWMYYAPAGAPADAPAERSYAGLMANGSVCAGIAESMTRFMSEDKSRGVAVFRCELSTITVEPN
jgi:hypothetical protein